ncbi:MAG: AraC family transcriptional regulator [Deltaproteobacteria bacterium]|nr:AraC family transcriptional regulator [Deltaproteobacteria bacterium]MBT6435564.1 AraC family transcriptional regulator [Deltaproteobacteria bacterium]MBT6492699.1 AraC family transcriptional regulator [Deltaproteobacteria bacterium]
MIKRVSIQWVRSIVRAAEASGVHPGTLLERCNLAPESLEGSVGFIPLSTTVNLWRVAQELSGDPYFGLTMGERVRPHYLSVVAYTMMNCRNFAEALEQVQKYQRLVSEGGRIEMRLEADTAAIVYIPYEADVSFSRHQIEAVLLVILGFARWLIDEDLQPIEIRFSHPKPALTQKHDEVFRAPIRFNAQEHAIVLERRWLHAELPESDPSMLQVHVAQADQRLHAMDKVSIKERVKMVLESSGHFQWDRDHMARRLHMSRRTLQRKLSKSGTTFQNLFDHYRHNAALTLLKDNDLSTGEVGLLLGFSEPSTFYRAFKRWEGCTPGAYRLAQVAI